MEKEKRKINKGIILIGSIAVCIVYLIFAINTSNSKAKDNSSESTNDLKTEIANEGDAETDDISEGATKEMYLITDEDEIEKKAQEAIDSSPATDSEQK